MAFPIVHFPRWAPGIIRGPWWAIRLTLRNHWSKGWRFYTHANPSWTHWYLRSVACRDLWIPGANSYETPLLYVHRCPPIVSFNIFFNCMLTSIYRSSGCSGPLFRSSLPELERCIMRSHKRESKRRMTKKKGGNKMALMMIKVI